MTMSRGNHASLVEALDAQVRQRPQEAAITFLADGDTVSEQLSYEALQRRVLALAARLQAEGAAGERVLLLLPSGIDYIVAFWACLHAKAVAVPLYPPGSSMHAARVARVAAHCGARWAITHSGLLAAAQRQLAQPGAAAARLRWIAADAAVRERPGPGAWRAPGLADGDLAFLQYTSGSTGDPRGVMVSHGNLLQHGSALAAALHVDDRDVMVSWLPLFHDMGLIGALLQPLLVGAQLVLMPPATFVQRPARWLEAITRHRGTMSFAPNFAFDLCGAVPVAGLDLSSWRLALNAAEPVQAETLRRFAQRFASAGLRESALAPSYGLAEATLMVSTHAGGAALGSAMVHVDAAELAQGRVRPCSAASARGQWLARCGRPLWPGSVAVVDPETCQALGEGRVGEIWVRSAAVAQGYWHNPEATQHTFHATLADGDGPWLRTGDLGAWWNGGLVVAGRIKDLVIVRGQNHHPGDLEHSAWLSHAALAPGRIAAFAVEVDGEERVAIAAELRRTERKRFDGLAIALGIAAALAEEYGLRLHALVLLPPGALPITSSGKVQRQACRRAFLEGRLDALYAWQAAEPAVGQADGDAAADVAMPRPEDSGEPLLDLLRELTADVLRLDDDRRAALRTGFGEQRLAMLGVDSLAAIELSHRLHVATGEELGVSTLLGGDVAADIARHLNNRVMMRRISQPAAQGEAEAGGTEVWTL